MLISAWVSCEERLPILYSTHPTRRTISIMSDVLELNCWTLGDDFDRFFPVKIVNSEQVSTLREVIKGEKKLKFDGSPPLPYSNLWKVQIDLNNADEEYLKEIKVNVQRRCPGCWDVDAVGRTPWSVYGCTKRWISVLLGAEPLFQAGWCYTTLMRNHDAIHLRFYSSYDGVHFAIVSFPRLGGRLFIVHLAMSPDHKPATNGPYSIVRHPVYIRFLFVRGLWIENCHKLACPWIVGCGCCQEESKYRGWGSHIEDLDE